MSAFSMLACYVFVLTFFGGFLALAGYTEESRRKQREELADQGKAANVSAAIEGTNRMMMKSARLRSPGKFCISQKRQQRLAASANLKSIHRVYLSIMELLEGIFLYFSYI